MTNLKIFVFFIFGCIAIYTGFVVFEYGPNFLPIFLGDLVAITWNGQFNLDFAGYLGVTALWVAWRHQFSPSGLVLGLFASVGGMLFFAPYLLFAISKANGDFAVLMMGDRNIATASDSTNKKVRQ